MVSFLGSFNVHAEEAVECMQDSSGRWFGFTVCPQTIVLEKKGLPEHISKLDVIEQPVPFGDLLRSLEDAGEVLVFLGNSSFAILFQCCKKSKMVQACSGSMPYY